MLIYNPAILIQTMDVVRRQIDTNGRNIVFTQICLKTRPKEAALYENEHRTNYVRTILLEIVVWRASDVTLRKI